MDGTRGVFGRRRRANAAEGPRDHAFQVKVTAAEKAALTARAAELGISVPRLLVDAAFNHQVETTVERKTAIAELFAVRRLMANVAGNMNQLARFANTEGVFPSEADAVAAEYRELVPRLKTVVKELSGS